MQTFSFDMYQTLAIAAVALLLGSFLNNKIPVLKRFCIPSPVTGGMVFAAVTCILYSAGIVEIVFTDTLREVCMVFFFTSVGFYANLKVLKAGGKALIFLVLLVTGMIVLQNVVAVSLSTVVGLDPLVGMCTGSVPMTGGHGISGAFGPILEDLGVNGALTICTAAATFGLIGGSLMGGPLGNSLIRKKDLVKTAVMDDISGSDPEGKEEKRVLIHYAPAALQLILAVGIGTGISYLLSLTGMSFPIYMGALIASVVIRNVGDVTGKIKIYTGEIEEIGGIMLGLFLGMAMISLKIWQLADLALPFLLLLAAQVVLMFVYARFVVFNVMGHDYDAAVISAGVCGFGMGATPNAMANMQAICDKYVPSVKAFLLIPIVGSLFNDLINSFVITFFINSV